VVEYVTDQVAEELDKQLAQKAMANAQPNEYEIAMQQAEAQAEARKRAKIQRINQPDLSGLSSQDLGLLQKALKESGMDLDQLDPNTPDDVRQEIMQLAAKAFDPTLLQDDLLVVPGPMGYGAAVAKDRISEPIYNEQGEYIGQSEPYTPIGKLRGLYDEYKLNPTEFLNSKGISTEGASYSVQRDITRIPPSMPDSYSRVIGEALVSDFKKQGYTEVTPEYLDVRQEAVTGRWVFRDPTLEGRRNTVHPPGLQWEDVKEQIAPTVVSLTPAIATVAAGMLSGPGFAAPSIPTAAILDTTAYALWRYNNLKGLNEEYGLEQENSDMMVQAISDSWPYAAGAVAGPVFLQLLAKHWGKLPKLSIDEKEMMTAINKVYKDRYGFEPNRKDIIRYLDKSNKENLLPESVRRQLSGFDFEAGKMAEFFQRPAFDTDRLLGMAVDTAGHVDPARAIRMTTPDVLLDAAERLGVNISSTNPQVLQKGLQEIANMPGELGTLARETLDAIDDQIQAGYIKLMSEGADLGLARTVGPRQAAETGTLIAGTLAKEAEEAQARVTQLYKQKELESQNAIQRFIEGDIDPSTAGTEFRKGLQTQYDELSEQINRGYDDLYKQAGGGRAQFDPTPIVEFAARAKGSRAKAIFKSLQNKDGTSVLDDILNLPKLKTAKNGRDFQNISYKQIKEGLEAVRGRLSDPTLLPEDRTLLLNLEDNLFKFRNNSLAFLKPELKQQANQLDDMFEGFAANYKSGIVSQILKKVTGNVDNYAVPNAEVLKRLLLPDDAMDNVVIKEAFDSATPQADFARRQVAGWLKANYKAKVQNPDGTFKVQSPTEHKSFFDQYGPLMREFLEPDEFEKFVNFSGAKTALKAEEKQLEKVVNRLSRTELGRVDEGILDLSRPERFFDELWGKNGEFADITYIKNVIGKLKPLAVQGNKVATKTLDDLQLYVARSMDKQVTFTVNGNRLIDPDKMVAYLDDFSQPLEEVFGKKFVKDIRAFSDMTKTMMPGRTQAGSASQDAAMDLAGQVGGANQRYLKVGTDLTRAYIGIFTRPGRFLTAGLRLYSGRNQKKILELMLDPGKIVSGYGVRKFIEDPLVQAMARQIAGGSLRIKKENQREIEEKPSRTEDDTEESYFFNSGGRVTLMPLEYNL